jgi:HEAT repeat protein
MDELLSKLAGRDPNQREWALQQALDRAEQRGGDSRQVARVFARALIADPDDSVRMQANEALGDVGNASDLFALSERTRDRDWTVRASAYSSMATACGLRAAQRIKAGLADPHAIVRRFAAVALYDLLGAKALEDLRVFLTTETDRRARSGGLAGLAAEGDSQAIKELRVLANEIDPHISSAAKSILSGLNDPPEERQSVGADVFNL